ncbi:MAG: hypothetical protein EAZ57_01430 [Cytophagales bacterium]|nr:MAG: hypothetical protein EAZ57_01430 [Cytophagales bacterium]
MPEPDYPDVPAIEFVDLTRVPSSTNNRLDSVYITLAFKDGDGDLGLATEDSLPPFQRLESPTKPNLFYNNFFLNIQRLEKGTFRTLDFGDPFVTLNGRFPRLNTLNKPTALEGTLRYQFALIYGAFGSPVRKGDTLRFEVQIADQKLNKSNIILTDTTIVGQK